MNAPTPERTKFDHQSSSIVVVRPARRERHFRWETRLHSLAHGRRCCSGSCRGYRLLKRFRHRVSSGLGLDGRQPTCRRFASRPSGGLGHRWRLALVGCSLHRDCRSLTRSSQRCCHLDIILTVSILLVIII